MAFRDETEALRQRRSVLREEIEALEADNRRLADELAETREAVTLEVNLKVGRLTSLMVVAFVAVPLVTLSILLGDEEGGSPNMLFGAVAAIEGDAPFEVGTPCTLFTRYIGNSQKSWDAQLELVCGGSTVYGGDGSGYLDCEWEDDLPARCVDDEGTAQSGDPELTLDRRVHRVLIEDAAPTYRMQVDLTAPLVER